MNDAHNFGFVLINGGSNFFGGKNFAERSFQLRDVSADSFCHVGHASAEDTVLTDDRFVAWFDQIDNARFHPRTPGATDGHRHLVFGLKDLPQHGLHFIHDLKEVRIQMPNCRRC